MKFRIIRTAAVLQLHAELEETRRERDQARGEGENATDSAIRAECVAEDLLTRLGQSLADNIGAARAHGEETEGLRAVIRQTTAERDAARKQAAAVDEVRAELARIRDDASDTETGATRKAAIAYRVLGRLYADAHANGQEPRPPFDLIGLVLGYDITPAPDSTPETADPAARRP